MYRWQKVDLIIHKVLLNPMGNTHYRDGDDYWSFTRPDNHIIYECRDEVKDEIVKILKLYGFNPIENDTWCGGRRIGIIVNGFKDEIGDDEV